MSDGIIDLLAQLRSDNKPSLAWTVRWSRDGMDPVHVAWDMCEYPGHMISLLKIYGKTEDYDNARAHWDLILKTRSDELEREVYKELKKKKKLKKASYISTAAKMAEWDRVISKHIREVVPIPPKLGEILAVIRAKSMILT